MRQGTIPEECLIILEGECKTVYEETINKSTKVSKFVKKCLQTDLPAPMHYNHLY